MATHPSILSWKIPWTQEPGGLQSTGLQRVGRNWAHAHTLTHTHTHPILKPDFRLQLNTTQKSLNLLFTWHSCTSSVRSISFIGLFRVKGSVVPWLVSSGEFRFCVVFFFFFFLWLKFLSHKLAPNIWFALWLASSSPVQSPSQGCWPLTQWGILPPRSWCPPFCEGRMSHVFKSISLVPSSLRMCTRGSRQDDPHLFVGTALLDCLVIKPHAVVLPLGSLPMISLLFLLIPREGESCSLLCIGWHLPTTLWLYKDIEHCEWGVGKEGWIWDIIQFSCGLAPPEIIFSPIYAGLFICQASIEA